MGKVNDQLYAAQTPSSVNSQGNSPINADLVRI